MTICRNSRICAVFFLMIFLSLLPVPLSAQAARIFMDGEFFDWESRPPAYSDPAGDQTGAVDFGGLWIANDEDALYLRLDVGATLNIQDFNNVVLYLDSDNDVGTGMVIDGIGAELEWNFGNRSGRYFRGGAITVVNHFPLGLVTAPTVTSDKFEISLQRSARPDGQNLLFSGAQIRLLFRDLDSGDALPNEPGGVSYTFSADPLPPLPFPAIARQDAGAIRVISYNVEFDGLSDPSRQPGFTRMLQALQPQIIGFQEIYSGSATGTAAIVEAMLPAGAGESWHAAKVGPDIVAVSRFPILQSFGIIGNSGSPGNGAFLIDLRPAVDSELLFIVAHPPCCSNNAGRQFEVDAIMAFIRDARNPGGPLDLAPHTPVIIVGDMNLVGDAQQLRTLLDGNIINNGTFGPDFSPDWDGSELADLRPRHLNQPQFFTWLNPGSSFSPGRLDFMIFTDAVIDVRKSYILFTRPLPPDTLSAYHLQPLDDAVSDHLPVVADLRFPVVTGLSSGERPRPDGFALAQNFPNPFNPVTHFRFQIADFGFVELQIFDANGRRVRTLLRENRPAGEYTIAWEGKDDRGQAVNSGVYFYQLRVGSRSAVKKCLLLK